MQSLTFLNAPLLWGLSLAAIPLIIHLLFRRRFRRVDWAPMRYLKLSIQRNRRRMRLEQLLLLLLRTAAILLLFTLVARPVLHASGLSRWLTGRSRASQFLILDDSLSMGYSPGGDSAFSAAKELTASLVRQIGPGDPLTLVLASQPGTPLLREAELVDPKEAIGLVEPLRPTESFVSWESVAAGVDSLLSASTFPIRDVTVITDLRRSGWEHDLAELGNRWAGGRVRLRIFDVGSQLSDNVSVQALEPVDHVALAARKSTLLPRCTMAALRTWTMPRPTSWSMASRRWSGCPRSRPAKPFACPSRLRLPSRACTTSACN